MTIRFPLQSLRNLLWIGGLSLLAYCGFVLAAAWWFQRETSAAFTLASTPARPASVLAALPASQEPVVGRLEIRRLGISVMVLQGTSSAILRRAAGHIAGTALPGQSGNVGVSAHRDTFFRPLQNIRRGDAVAFTTRSGTFRYRVVSVSVVRPDDISILTAGDVQSLTLVTCYPFMFAGSAPERFIVRAERVI